MSQDLKQTSPIARGQRGFTLLEILIVMTIVGILAGLSAPSFTQLMRNIRVQNASTSLLGAFNAARAEAIRTGRSTTICAANDPSVDPPVCGLNWATGWAIFNDADSDSVIDPGELFRVGSGDNQVVVGGGAPTMFLFDGRGRPIDAVNRLPLVPGNYIFDANNCASGKDKRATIGITSVGQTRMTAGYCP